MLLSVPFWERSAMACRFSSPDLTSCFAACGKKGRREISSAAWRIQIGPFSSSSSSSSSSQQQQHQRRSSGSSFSCAVTVAHHTRKCRLNYCSIGRTPSVPPWSSNIPTTIVKSADWIKSSTLRRGLHGKRCIQYPPNHPKITSRGHDAYVLDEFLETL